ncbi:IDEAL domain-containing protein [Mesobacillus persicus]|uniref:IDEAL domain-containing protein n=1 Tax=Mesobacillus persicus TaxID=930146 RepID=A0A1H8IW05_9BACI|nr:IDEAL domain-containing protein [Mesobacillus persicus]SEN72216.1 IDEAL domain-containing protein [Mesobacillus persicus]
MATNHHSVLKIGDWVKGESREGELIIGYVDSFTVIEEVVNVNVVTSDNQETVGKTIQLLSKQVKILPESNVKNKEQINYLIDLALSTGDEEWFLELSAKLKAMDKLVNEAIY